MSNTAYSTYESAFNDMLELTKANAPFKLAFVKQCGAIKIIAKALLRKQTPSSKDKNGSYKFNLIDTVNDNYVTAYIPLIQSVNDKTIVLS
ncbi:hypothetical protein ES692_06165 [Psychroserpens burtonensis]|uniref:Uncharacterized protein n=1 Tax=Psychroserpens burtonensis TaxID=49278 RepID=A0A5C7B8L0_9FLAO|nr:hypothetical protein [Psychroserpens burtonensis]TXE18626.1 hypothetical protein ES692_06165 [Psychroserpens burtonensis]